MARFTVTCPHCRALLEIDDEKRVIASSKPVERERSTTSMEERLSAIAAEKQAASEKMAEAFRAEKAGAELREEKFKKLLGELGDEPVEKPIKDIDLD